MNRRLALVVVALLAVLGVWLLRPARRPVTAVVDAAAPALATAPGSDEKLPRSSLRGRITDAGGGALAGAEVCVRAHSRRLGAKETAPRCAVSGADGTYRLDDVPPATYGVGAAKPGFLPATPRQIPIGAGSVREHVDFALAHGGVAVHGIVHDRTGGPVARATVAIAPAAVVVRSGDDGRFEAWVGEGSLDVVASADGYAPVRASALAPGAAIELVLTPESTLAGRVVEADGETPVPDCVVSAGPTQAVSLASDAMTSVTDADGRFLFRGLEPGRYKPSAACGGHRGLAKSSVLLGLADRVTDVVVETDVVAFLRARVTVPGGEGCAGAELTLVERETRASIWATAGEGGEVLVDAVSPGVYDVNIACPDTAPKRIERAVTVADRPVTGIVWEVGQGLRLRGRVVDPRGNPVAGATIEALLPASVGGPRATSAADGTFVLRGLDAAEYRLLAWADGLAPPEPEVSVRIDRDRDDVRLALTAGGSVEGSVVEKGGPPVGGVNVEASGPGPEARAMTRDDGTFKLAGLAPGEWELKFFRGGRSLVATGTDGAEPPTEKTTVKAGAATKLRVTVEPETGTIRGRVVDGAGAAVDDAFVDAERASPSREDALNWMRSDFVGRAPVFTDRDGNFILTKLPPGAYVVRANQRGGAEAFVDAELGKNVVLTLRADAKLAGTLTGDVPRTVRIFVRDETTGYGRTEPFRGRTFTMSDLPAGTYEIQVRETLEGPVLGHATVPVGPGERRDVEIALRAAGP